MMEGRRGRAQDLAPSSPLPSLPPSLLPSFPRLGGRAAVMSMMGLDLLQDTGISSQLNSVMETVEGLGEVEKLMVFFCLWVVAKSVCLDALALVREGGREGEREGKRDARSLVPNLGPS